MDPSSLKQVGGFESVLVTFGSHHGGVHFEQAAVFGYAQHVLGQKRWRLWRPSMYPPRGEPHLILEVVEIVV